MSSDNGPVELALVVWLLCHRCFEKGVEPEGTEMAMKQELKEGNQDHLGKNMHQSCWRKNSGCVEKGNTIIYELLVG